MAKAAPTESPDAAPAAENDGGRVAAFTIGANGERRRRLAGPIRAHGGKTIEEIVLRKPRYRDIMDHGDPTAYVLVEGGAVPQTDMVTIEKYIVALSGIDPGLLEQIDYTDALALRDAVKSFF